MPSDEQTSLSNAERACAECACASDAGGAGGAGGCALWRAAAAEVAGTALLVALTCLAACAAPDAPLLHRALAGGLVVTLLVQCFDHVSGAMLNPTVTLAAVVRGRVGGAEGAALAAAQLAGAALGPALLHAMAPADPAPAAACLTLPAAHLSAYKAVAIEAVLGGCLALANCASWDARNRLLVESWPARIGLIVTALSLAAGELTGASMNPARSFGPALWAGNFHRHWVYWAGPLSGSLVCAALYAVTWRAAPGAPARADPGPRPLPRACAHPRPHTRPHTRPRDCPRGSTGPTATFTSDIKPNKST